MEKSSRMVGPAALNVWRWAFAFDFVILLVGFCEALRKAAGGRACRASRTGQGGLHSSAKLCPGVGEGVCLMADPWRH